MADIKISALTALTGANVDQALDVIPVVDTSVTTTKKMTFAEFFTNRTLVTPTLGVASATSINKVAFTAPATSATLTLADGKTLTCSNTLTFTGTDASSVAFGAGGTVLYSGGALGTPSGGTLTNCTGLPIAGTTGYGAGVATWLATASSANLYSAMTTKTGSGGSLVFATGPTISALTTSGISTSDGAQVLTANAMGALAIDVTKGLNTKAVNADSTFTFSGAPATTNTVFQLAISNQGATARTMTLPALCLNADTLAAASTAILPASGAMTLTFRWDGTNYLTYGLPSSSIALGTAGVAAGSAVFSNATSGSITVAPIAGALGTVTLTLPAKTATVATTSQTDSGFSFGPIATVADQDYVITCKAPHAGTLTDLAAKTDSGTCTVTWKINTTAVTTGVNSATSTISAVTPSAANVFAAGDIIKVTVSSNSTALNLQLAARYTRTLL